MRHALCILLVTSFPAFAQFTLYPNRDGSYTATPDTMPDRPYTPYMEENMRGAMAQRRPYSYDELEEKYPVREVVPRSMLPIGAQRKLEEDELVQGARKLQNDNARLEYETQKNRLALQTRQQEEAIQGLQNIRNLNPEDPGYIEQRKAFVTEHPYGIAYPALASQLSVLDDSHARFQQNADITARSQVARQEAQDATLTNEALRSAAQYGDPDLINRVASAPTGRDAMGVLTQAAGQLEQQQYINALTDAGVTGDEWNRFYVQPDQQISPNAKPIFNKEAARAYIATKQKEEVSAPKELEAKYRAAESTLNRLLARKAKGDDWSDDDENKLTRISRVAEDLGQQYLGVEAAAPSTKTQPATMQPPASTQATKQGVSIPTPKSQAEVVSIRNDATATLEKARQMGATPDKIKEITSKINERLISSGIPPI